METFDILKELITTVPVAGVMYLWVRWLQKEVTKLQEIVTTQAQENKALAEKSIKVITLAEDKITKDNGSNEKIIDIHRISGEILEIIKGWRNKTP